MSADREPHDDESSVPPAAAPASGGYGGSRESGPGGAGAPADQIASDGTRLEDLAEAARAQRDAAAEPSEAEVAGARGRRADESRPRRRPTAAAQGERNAVVGYLGQYEVAASRTLAMLRDGTLVAVRVADVSAGQIDDFQLRSAHRVDAHQVKWSLHPGSVGYAEFVRDAEGRTRYIRQLADGWERLSALHHPRRVVVHFVTNDLPSTGASQTIPRPPDAPGTDAPSGDTTGWSFAAFLAEAWQPAVTAARTGADLHSAVPARWAPAMAALAEASGLLADAWARFLAACELEFGVPSLSASVAVAPVSDAERAVLRNDADRLAHAYMQLVARPDRRIEFTRDELLDALGWRFRAEFRSTHEFPDPEIPYRSIAATAREVTDAVGQFTGGYLAVIGSPGSGKSTLLTRTLRESPHLVVRYYAYVRGAVGGSSRRGEAVNFFHDLSVALDRAGLHAGATLPVDDLDLLVRRVHTQLARAHDEWAAGGRRTVILVDGLDHIPREQRPTMSLLEHLPPPEDVPDGVLFVLGTQTDRLQGVSLRIRSQLDEPGRRIGMRPLERRDVVDIVEAATELAPAPTPAERDRIFDLSGGHPLALNYIVNRLRHAQGEAVARTLDTVEPFRDGIDRQYDTLWGTVEDDVDLARLLALLARARGPVRIDWLRRWAPRQALHAVTTRLAYLFRQEHGGRWAFFHNSFRAFLVERTRDLPALGNDSELFAELADRCASVDASEPERSDELYYRARAGDTLRVLALADPEALRAQFVAGRSATTIRDDLALAFDAAVVARDIVALTRVLLCSAEFVQREYYAELLPLAETWLELGDVDLALAALREGASLRTSRETALRAAVAVDAQGLRTEARDVFALAEPLDVRRGTAERTRRPQDELEVLDAWVAAAPRFRTVSDIVEMIRSVRASADEVWSHEAHDRADADEAESKGRQYRLLHGLAGALDQLGRYDDADQVRATLREQNGPARWWIWTQTVAWFDALAAGDGLRAATRFAMLRDAFERGEIPDGILGPMERVVLASGYVRVAREPDAAARLLEGVGQPEPVSDATHGDDWGPFHQRFALNRVLGALGDERPLDAVVPDVTPRNGSRWDQGTALTTRLERGVVLLGRLAGRAWVDRHLAPSDFEVQARSLVRLFPDNPQLVFGGYVALRAREGFYSRLVQAAAAHGSACVAKLQQLFEVEWSDERRRDAWPNALVRATLVELLRAGAPGEWVRTWLARVEPTTFRGEDLETDLPDAVAQARAWASAGDVVAARTTFARALRAAFGNEAKDDQLSACLAWAVRANAEDPAGAPERLSRMAAAVLSLDGSEAQGYVAPDLLDAGVAAGARPARALVEWALANDIREWVSALTRFLDGLVTRAPAAGGTVSTCYRALVLPFSRSAAVHSVARIGAALRAQQDSRELDALTRAIDVVALGSTRPSLREAVAGRPEEAAELLRDEGVSDPTAPEQVVDAFEGLSLTLRELRGRVRSVADVQDLAGRLKPNAYSYRWELILAPFLSGATPDELVAAAEAIPHNSYAWRVLADIAARMLGLGDPRARAVIDSVVQASRAAGWWERYDGGSRLSAYELLVRVAPDEGRQATWEAIRADIASGEVRVIDVFRSWDRVVAMLSSDTPASAIWDVVSRHVEALTAFAPRGEPLVLPAAEDSSNALAAVEAVSGLVARYLDHPTYALAQGAQQFFTDRLLAGDAVAEAVLVARLADDGSPKDGALLVLRAVALALGAVPASAREPLNALRHAPDYRDRRAASALLPLTVSTGGRDIGDDAPTLVERPLPAVFTIVHPPAPPPRRRALPGRGAMLEPAEDAADLVSTFRAELDLLAGWADVQPEALYRYVAERATAYLPSDDQRYAFDDEPTLRDELRRLGLEVTYRRPRPRRVERAMAEAAAMLVDHGRIGRRYFSALDRLFRNADPYFLLARPVCRPAVVPPIPERAISKYVEDEWTTHVTTDEAATGSTMEVGAIALEVTPHATLNAVAQQPPTLREAAAAGDTDAAPGSGQWIVLAEETWLRWLDWKHPTETRVGVRLEPSLWAEVDPDEDLEEDSAPGDIDGDIAAGKALAAHLADFSHLMADEYPARARVPFSIIVRNTAYRFETPGGNWMALNPALAEHLGWQPAPPGLFRWVDAEGRVMAESVWWQDGFAQQRPPQFEEEVGHGWLVLVSADGWRQLAAAVGDCVDWRRVARLAQDQAPEGLIDWKPVASEQLMPEVSDSAS